MSRLILFATLSVCLVATGCRTDRESLPSVASLRARLGRLTYDDAVRQMGPPAKRIELGDHSSVAEWIAETESRPSFSFGLGSSVGRVETDGGGATIGGGVTHVYRQLQFDQAGRLAAVEDVKR